MEELQKLRLETLEVSLDATKPPEVSQLCVLLWTGSLCGGKEAQLASSQLITEAESEILLSELMFHSQGGALSTISGSRRRTEKRLTGHSRLHPSQRRVRVFLCLADPAVAVSLALASWQQDTRRDSDGAHALELGFCHWEPLCLRVRKHGPACRKTRARAERDPATSNAVLDHPRPEVPPRQPPEL